MTIGAKEIKESGKVAVELADPRVFPAIVAVACIAGVCVLLYWQRNDMREDRSLFLRALDNNTAAIQHLTDELRSVDRRAAR